MPTLVLVLNLEEMTGNTTYKLVNRKGTCGVRVHTLSLSIQPNGRGIGSRSQRDKHHRINESTTLGRGDDIITR